MSDDLDLIATRVAAKVAARIAVGIALNATTEIMVLMIIAVVHD